MIDPEYETDIACYASFVELKHLLSILTDESPFTEPPSFTETLLDIAASCIRNPRFDHIRLDDPQFFLSAVRALPGMAVGGRYDT